MKTPKNNFSRSHVVRRATQRMIAKNANKKYFMVGAWAIRVKTLLINHKSTGNVKRLKIVKL